MDDDTSESGAIDLDGTAIAESLAAAGYELTLFAGVGLIVGGIDDLIVDGVYLWHRARRRLAGKRAVTLADMRPTGKRLAIFIAAWDESAVIGRMLANLSQQLTSDRLTVFVGAYPNDPATIEAIAGVAEGDRRIRLVVGMRAGPTTKADCLNAVWRAMIEEEALSAEAFDAVILHDAEDVVHAGELTVIDHYLTTCHAVQLPVVPLAHPGAPLVGGTYLDEFAEAHGKSLVVRGAVGAGLPLAGVGCAIARPVLAGIAAARAGQPFDAASLTEDYELGLTIAGMGGRMTLAQVAEATGGPPVAVRAYFPVSFQAAARQKARWMLGIALAGWDRTGWGRSRHAGEWWMRMRDRRAPIATVVLLAAYVALTLWAVRYALSFAGISAPPLPAGLQTILGLNAALLVWRMIVRAAFVARLYGAVEALRSAPRMLVGNIVAMAAARHATVRYIRMLRGAPTRWDKTAHEFPDTVPGT